MKEGLKHTREHQVLMTLMTGREYSKNRDTQTSSIRETTKRRKENGETQFKIERKLQINFIIQKVLLKGLVGKIFKREGDSTLLCTE